MRFQEGVVGTSIWRSCNALFGFWGVCRKDESLVKGCERFGYAYGKQYAVLSLGVMVLPLIKWCFFFPLR